MDEYNTGMDPEVKRYFRRIIKSFTVGLLWLLSVATAGIFFKLGELRNGAQWYNVLFYSIAFLSLLLLLWYYYKSWNKKI